VVDNSTSPTLSRLLTASQSKGNSLKSTGSSGETSASGQGAENLCAEMGDLMHDFEVVSRIQELAASLRGNYQVKLNRHYIFRKKAIPGKVSFNLL